MPTLCLAQHADYLCRHSGACCTSNWPIHVEVERVEPIRAAVASGRLMVGDEGCDARDPLVVEEHLPPGAGALLRAKASGACVFYDAGGRRCAIHRDLGHGALPSACQHFPRRCLIERDTVLVSLSHYCPTVARMPFDSGSASGIVAAPESLVGRVRLEGLDARDVLPPVLREGVLTDVEGYHSWERAVIGLLEADETPETSLARIRTMTERVQSWSPRNGALAGAVDVAARGCRAAGVQAEGRCSGDQLRTSFELARTSIPEAMRPAATPSGLRERDARWIGPAWEGFSRPLGRFLAAHAFGNWCAYLGADLGTVVRSLDLALAIVRVEAGRLAAEGERMLDEATLAEAFRSADLLLVHLADPNGLAAALDYWSA